MPTPTVPQISAKLDALAIFVTSIINEAIDAKVLDRAVVAKARSEATQIGAALDISTRSDEQVINARRMAELQKLFAAISWPKEA
ncbi:MAG: hypothetical protein ACREFO_01005 [Acetobacteraceae bacterium]